MKTTFEMAREAGWDDHHAEFDTRIEHLVELAREEANARANASWTLMCEKMVAIEREACAKVCDVLAAHPEYASEVTKLAAMAIRARGNK